MLEMHVLVTNLHTEISSNIRDHLTRPLYYSLFTLFT